MTESSITARPLRITFLSPIGTVGGAERVLLDVIASLRPVLPAGSAMHVICFADGPMLDECRSLGATAEVVALPPGIAGLGESGLRGKGRLGKTASLALRMIGASPAALGYVRRLRKAVVASRADIIHTNGVKAHLLSRLLPRSAGAVAWHIHDLLGSRALLANSLKYAAGHICTAIAISHAVADDLRRVLPGKPVATVLNGIDTQHFIPGAGDDALLDRLSGLPEAPPKTLRIGLIATYARWKGQDVFLKAAAQLTHQPARFYIIGGSIYQTTGSSFTRPELQQMATALGVDDRVGFVDFQSDPLAVFQALDIVVHASSKPEPFGRTIAEGMACGRAVIVSAAGGAVELFSDGIDALATPPGDVDALADNLRRLIESPSLRKSLGEHARQTAVNRFDRARLGPEMLAIYQRACGIIPTTSA